MTQGPFIVVTAVLDAGARPAAVTVNHGQAMERAYNAVGANKLAGLDIVELTIHPQTFAMLRKVLGKPADTAGVYDIFPLAPHLSPTTRTVAAQFLAAEALWQLEEQGHFESHPMNLRLDLPRGWDTAPQAIHEKLVAERALDLSEDEIRVYKEIRAKWDASAS